MKEFGEFLRQHRVSRGITLEAIENRTRIRMQHLLAIENGQFDRLPESTYVKAFLRHYAKCIGLDEKDVLKRYESLAGEMESESVQGSNRNRSERRARQFRARRRRRTFQWVALLVVIGIIAAYRIWGIPWDVSDRVGTMSDANEPFAVESVPPESANALVDGIDSPTETALEVIDDLDTGSHAIGDSSEATGGSTTTDFVIDDQPDQRSASETEVAVVPAIGSLTSSYDVEQFRLGLTSPGRGPFVVPLDDVTTGFDLTLEATDRSWTELWVDGDRAIYRTLEANERVTYNVKATASLRLGRAENVLLEVGDIFVGSVGEGIVDKELITQSLDGSITSR